jgi:hypothetical protein
MIDFSKSIEARKRQNSVWVENIEYVIHTGFYHWICFSRKFESWQKEGRETFNLEELDYLYVWNPPENKLAGYEELCKFYRNEQPLPRETGKEGDIETVDWIIDSERIRAAFLLTYHIDLLTTDLHWHDFHGLFMALFSPLKEVVEARLYKTPEKTKDFEKRNDEINKQKREMWKLESEVKAVFKMR